MSKMPLFKRRPHNSSLALSAATLSANSKTVVISLCLGRLSSLTKAKMAHRKANVATHTLSLKPAASGDFFLCELIAMALVIQLLWLAICIRITNLFLCTTERICAIHPSPHKAAQTGISWGRVL